MKLATSLVNIIINHSEELCEPEVKILEESIFQYLSSSLESYDLNMVALKPQYYFRELKCLNLDKLEGIVVTVCHQDNEKVIAGSHSNRFYSLEISERFNSLPVINIQVTNQRGLDSITFSTGDINLTKLFVNTLNSYYRDKYLRNFTGQIELIFEESI